MIVLHAHDEPIGVSEAQASWMLEHRERFRADARRDPSCFGCGVFGLCITHGTAQQEEQNP